MALAEQIRNRGRKQTRSLRVVSSSSSSAMASQQTVTDAINNADNSQNDYVNQQIAAFGTSLALVYEPKIATGTTGQFLRGDKTWQPIAINDVTGLSTSLSGLSSAAAAKVAKTGDTMTGPLVMPTYLKAALPSAATYARSMIYVSDLTGGAEFCFSDGTSWRRMTDRSIAN